MIATLFLKFSKLFLLFYLDQRLRRDPVTTMG